MKMKLFGIKIMNKIEPDALALEQEINAWLVQHPGVKILEIKQSSNGGSFNSTKVFVSVWYEEGT